VSKNEDGWRVNTVEEPQNQYYQNAGDILDLALEMQAKRYGITLDDIAQKFGCSRRKAERMRDAIRRIFGDQIDEVDQGDGFKRWRLLPGTLNKLVAFDAEELLHLTAAAKLLRHENRNDAADALEHIELKLRALMRQEDLTRVENDLEVLVEAEGLAMRPGPRPKIDPKIISGLRRAILTRSKIRIRYRSHTGVSWHKVCPYGFLYGIRPHLIAFSRNPKILDFRNYRLSGIIEIEEIPETFEPDPEFSLEAYARRSFGMYQEEPFDVVWKFSPTVAAEAREFEFHPDQTMEDLDDGSLIVKFRAGGALEMSWHLYTWGDEVEVLEPKDFLERY
jgi:predicted DNA-binding transcriptional regulator YafY